MLSPAFTERRLKEGHALVELSAHCVSHDRAQPWMRLMCGSPPLNLKALHRSLQEEVGPWGKLAPDPFSRPKLASMAPPKVARPSQNARALITLSALQHISLASEVDSWAKRTILARAIFPYGRLARNSVGEFPAPLGSIFSAYLCKIPGLQMRYPLIRTQGCFSYIGWLGGWVGCLCV